MYEIKTEVKFSHGTHHRSKVLVKYIAQHASPFCQAFCGIQIYHGCSTLKTYCVSRHLVLAVDTTISPIDERWAHILSVEIYFLQFCESEPVQSQRAFHAADTLALFLQNLVKTPPANFEWLRFLQKNLYRVLMCLVKPCGYLNDCLYCHNWKMDNFYV